MKLLLKLADHLMHQCCAYHYWEDIHTRPLVCWKACPPQILSPLLSNPFSRPLSSPSLSLAHYALASIHPFCVDTRSTSLSGCNFTWSRFWSLIEKLRLKRPKHTRGAGSSGHPGLVMGTICHYLSWAVGNCTPSAPARPALFVFSTAISSATGSALSCLAKQ